MARVYIAGPMTGLPSYNREAFDLAAKALHAAGHIVITPMAGDSIVYLREYGRSFNCDRDICEYSDPMLRRMFAENLRLMLTCDEVFLLPGWRESKGARAEVQVALLFDIPCLEDRAEYIQAIASKRIESGTVRVMSL